MLGSNKHDQATGTKKKISSNDADKAKNQYDKLLNLVKYEKNDQFHNFNFKKDRLDSFLANYLISDSTKICGTSAN